MENNFNNRDFEQFVKQNADQYRMFPSEKVWKNIHHALHTRRRWYGLGFIVLLLTAGIVTWVMLTPSVRNNGSLSYQPAAVSQSTPSEQKNIKTPILITAAKPADIKSRFITTNDNLQNSLFIAVPANSLSGYNDNEKEKNTVIPVLPNMNEPSVLLTPSAQIEWPAKPAVVYHERKKTEKPATTNIVSQANNSNPLFSANNTAGVTAVPDKNPVAEKGDVYPLSIESVVNSYHHQRVGKKLTWEVFFTPTVSYRKLTENKAFINSTQANNNMYSYTSVADINHLVTHRPDMGFQLGFNAGYPITKSLRIITGFQLNVSKYDIRASFSAGEVATIALNTGGGANSVSTISNYRNSSNSKADWLRNLYFSASVPVGLELKLTGGKKTQLGVSGTIQPAYILSDRAYLLSTDYKNYAEVPSLTRRWNMSTSFDFFAAYSIGKINWRIGPQIRYQLRSSFVEKYPVKEHLFDFGLKVGMMLKK